jgi:hypothetical protein
MGQCPQLYTRPDISSTLPGTSPTPQPTERRLCRHTSPTAHRTRPVVHHLPGNPCRSHSGSRGPLPSPVPSTMYLWVRLWLGATVDRQQGALGNHWIDATACRVGSCPPSLPVPTSYTAVTRRSAHLVTLAFCNGKPPKYQRDCNSSFSACLIGGAAGRTPCEPPHRP